LAAHWIDDHVNTATIGDLDQNRARLRSEDNVRALRGHETTLGVATSNANHPPGRVNRGKPAGGAAEAATGA
jgi:hypothetical protein